MRKRVYYIYIPIKKKLVFQHHKIQSRVTTDVLVVGTEERSDVLCIPCLGRPFRLGTAYDLCRDAIVPCLRPWSNVAFVFAESTKKADKEMGAVIRLYTNTKPIKNIDRIIKVGFSQQYNR